jgi:hypothetical protein
MLQVPNKKENIENLQKKLGEVLGLERAAQKAVDELIEMKLLKSVTKNEAKEIQEEASTHEEKIKEVARIF